MEEWSIGVLEEWDRIEGKALKVRKAIPTRSSMENMCGEYQLRCVAILQSSITPILHAYKRTMIGRANCSNHAKKT